MIKCQCRSPGPWDLQVADLRAVGDVNHATYRLWQTFNYHFMKTIVRAITVSWLTKLGNSVIGDAKSHILSLFQRLSRIIGRHQLVAFE